MTIEAQRVLPCQSPRHSLNVAWRPSGPTLAELPEAIKAGIVAMVKAALPER